MAEFILFYDSNDDDIVTMAKRRAPEIGAKAIPIRDVPALKDELLHLKSGGAKVDRMLFYAHGTPGGVNFGLSVWTAKRIASEFAGLGLETVFMPGAHVFFPSCDLGSVEDGCAIAAAACYLTDNGPVFLMKFAQTFLSRGGRVGASNTAGWGFPLWGSKIYHLNYTSETTYAIVSPSGRARLASGSPVSDPSDTSWKVAIGAESRTYDFKSDGTVGRFEEDDSWWSWSTPSADGPRGRWRLERDTLEVTWPNGRSESWDVPIFSSFETGIARTPDRKETALFAELSYVAGW